MPAKLRPALHAATLAISLAAPVSAQRRPTIDIYRFILGVDVPEPPALVAMGLAPSHMLRGAAPKPIVAGVAFDIRGPAAAIDISPYFLAGGGTLPLDRWRSMSIGGRLRRVLAKTLLSLAVIPARGDSAALVALALRSTIHDPHDPTLATRLPEEHTADSVSHDAFDRARELIRARSGDAQVALGWGFAGRLGGGVLSGDSLDTIRHTAWISAQFTTSRQLDLLSTIQVRSVGRADARVQFGAGVQRKSARIDYRAELAYDTRSHDLHPGFSVDARVLSRLGLTTALLSEPADFAGIGPRRLAVRALAHWFYASDL